MNSFGQNLRVQIYGESHGSSVGIIIDGVPAGISIKKQDFIKDLSRRKPGKKGTTQRIEKDEPIFESGIYNNYSTGSPIHIRFKNRDVKSKNYNKYQNIPRPGHADFVATKKYRGYNDYRGGGQFSGRLTVGLVAAGVIAKKIINSYTIEAKIEKINDKEYNQKNVKQLIKKNDTFGGIVKCIVTGIDVGLGEPFFNSVESVISHLLFSIPGIKAVEFGSGFDTAKMSGSEYNDEIINSDGKTKTNHSGGINGGISNGNNIEFKAAVRPGASIPKKQITYNFKKKKLDELKVDGRHDKLIILRVPVIVEAVTAIGIADLKLSKKNIRKNNN